MVVDLKILSAGSTVYGLRTAATALCAGQIIEIATEHGHLIHEQALAGLCAADIVFIPEDLIEDLDRKGLTLAGSRVRIGTTGIGYAVRAGDRAPDIRDAATLASAVEACVALYLTTAPTGTHMRACLDGLGLSGSMSGKLTLFDRAIGMLAALAASNGSALAFGPTSELAAWRSRGISYCGPVPEAYDAPLVYAAAILKATRDPQAAGDLLKALSGPEGLRHFRDSGVI